MAARAFDPSGPPNSYIPSFPYSDKRLLDAPRVQVPPPALDYENGEPSFQVLTLPFEQTSAEYGNPQFLKALSVCHKLDMTHSMLTWQYEMRRNAQPILPFLLLGPSSTARDVHFVKTHGITLLVSVRNLRTVRARPSLLDPATFPSSAGISTLCFDFEDTWDFIPRLRPIVKTINDHLETTCSRMPIQAVKDIRGKILVFCESGNDRSSVLVVAYLMLIYGISAFAAVNIVQSQRFCVTTSDEMKNVLLNLQEIISAERQVALTKASATRNDGLSVKRGISKLPHRPKRNVDVLYESDEDMELDTHKGNISMREGVSPFTDVVD